MKRINKINKLSIFFFKNFPYIVIFTIVFSLLAQLFLISSYFLPIKVVILLSQEKIPDDLSAILFNIERNEIILIMTLLIFIVYGLYLLFDKFSILLTQYITERLFSTKKESMEAKNKLVYKYVDSYFKFISTFTFLVFLFCVTLYFYSFVGIIILLYL